MGVGVFTRVKNITKSNKSLNPKTSLPKANCSLKHHKLQSSNKETTHPYVPSKKITSTAKPTPKSNVFPQVPQVSQTKKLLILMPNQSRSILLQNPKTKQITKTSKPTSKRELFLSASRFQSSNKGTTCPYVQPKKNQQNPLPKSNFFFKRHKFPILK